MHPNVADTLNELGNIASMRDNYDEAGADFSRVEQESLPLALSSYSAMSCTDLRKRFQPTTSIPGLRGSSWAGRSFDKTASKEAEGETIAG